MQGLALWRAVSRRMIHTRSYLWNEGKAAESSIAEMQPAKAPYIKKKKKLIKFGLDESTAGELQRLQGARREIDKWLEHPTFFNMISEDALANEKPQVVPPGEGPVLHWETCVVFPYDGTSFHPANRRVKATVRVRELGLEPMQRRRLLDLVQRRYKPETDELTITFDKFEQREDNRKEVLRILYALLEEATNPIAAVLANEKTKPAVSNEDVPT